MSTVKHLSYAGITLPLSPSFLEEQWLKVVHNHYETRFGDFWNFDKPNTDSLPTPSLPNPPKFRLDVLEWPNDASRCAWFHTIVDTKRWNAISETCAPSGYNTPQDLVMYDGRSGKTITAQMYIAGAARPLNQLGSQYSDLWLLTLVDQRFYWNYNRTNISTPLTWEGLYEQLATALEVSITVDTVDSAYGTPSAKWALAYQGGTNAILDAVAANVGQRIVVGLDGSVRTVNWQTAKDAAYTYINDVNGVVISGGLVEIAGIAKSVPGSVQVLFPDTSGGPISANPHVVTNTLSFLSISEYGSATGLPSYTQTIYGDLTYTGSNSTEVDAYADQASRDYYGWQLTNVDLVYPGIEPYEPTGWEDCIEWTLKLIEQNPALPPTPDDDPYSKTQVRRGPWTDIPSGNFLQNSGGGGDVTVNNYPTMYIPQGDDGEDFIPIPGPIGPRASDGVNGRDGRPGPDPEDPELPLMIPGLQGLQGFTGVGIPGIPGRDGEDAELPLVIPGDRGVQGLRGYPGLTVPGMDGEDAELPLVIPGLRGLQGFTGTGQIGPPGLDGEDSEPPIIQLVTNTTTGSQSLQFGSITFGTASPTTVTFVSFGTTLTLSAGTWDLYTEILATCIVGGLNTTPNLWGMTFRVIDGASTVIGTYVLPTVMIPGGISSQQIYTTGLFPIRLAPSVSTTYSLQVNLFQSVNPNYSQAPNVTSANGLYTQLL